MLLNIQELPDRFFSREDTREKLVGTVESRTPIDRLNLRLSHMGGRGVWTDLKIIIGGNFSGRLNVVFGRPNGYLEFGDDVRFNADINLWNEASVSIGSRTTCNKLRIILDYCRMTVGKDCMISDEVKFQGGDQHGIFDVDTLETLNEIDYSILLEDHVWIGRNSTIMGNVKVGKGSIVALGSIVTKDVLPQTLVAGIPATEKKANCSWTRNSRPNMEEKIRTVRSCK